MKYAPLFLLLLAATTHSNGQDDLDAAAVKKYATLALESIHREYPNKISHVLSSADDVQSPRELTPVFYGSYDWHSAVHGHWLLVRLCRLYPDADFVSDARSMLEESFQADSDVGVLDEYLIYLEAKWRLLNRMGLPYQEEKAEARQVIDNAIARDGGAKKLWLAGKRQYQLLGPQNIPDTGFGS